MPATHFVHRMVKSRATAVAFIAFSVVLSCTAFGFYEARAPSSLSGRVLNEDGDPIAGATVFVTANPGLKKRTDEKGGFQFSESETERLLNKAMKDRPSPGVDVVAVSDGFGLDWIKVRTYATTSSKEDLNPAAARNITLRLPGDLPIHGQLVDGKGHPIPNVKIELGQVLVLPRNDLTRWLTNWETSRGRPWSRLANLAEKRYRPVRRRFLFPAERPLPVSTEPNLATTFTTDKEGRFSIAGVGRERAVWLRVSHSDFVTRIVFVATRARCTLKPADASLPPLHPASFVQVLEPARPIQGIVREHRTNQPLAGATVYMEQLGSRGSGVARATSAVDGTFKITGLGAGRVYRCVIVAAPGQPHLRREYRIAATADLKPLDVRVDLFRGTVIKGVVKNKKTGEPLFSVSLTYLPAPGNSNLEGFRESGDGAWDDRLLTGLDGSFNMAIPPGPGLICVRAWWDGSGDRFHPCREEAFPYPLKKEEGEAYFKSATGRIIRPEQFHAVVKVNPGKESRTGPLNIVLDPK